ncbi:L-threonylcarbamoyladenylate synthase [Myxococcota bacterium]|nr:L-threonylcarbamoyladenylate synthase [Myxococcota bacterium]
MSALAPADGSAEDGVEESRTREAAADALAAAVAHVRAGGLLAFPTETVWGLGADARSEAALARLRRWKGRSAGQPVAVLVASAESAQALGLPLHGAAQRLAAAFWPGPLTLVVPAPPDRFAAGVARADGAVGLRCSSHPRTAALVAALERAGVGPLTATSLNRHGEPPVRTRTEALALCRGDAAPRCFELDDAARTDAARDAAARKDTAGAAAAGAQRAGGDLERAASAPTPPSTVVDCTGPRPVVLRPGPLTPATLERVLGERVSCERLPGAGAPDARSPDQEIPSP